MGLIPGLTPPTNDTDLTFALGGICFVYYLYQGFARQGPKYLLSFFGPLWWLVLTCGNSRNMLNYRHVQESRAFGAHG
jgi:F0F1-type ATP synthase membrane subunit a